MAALLEIPGATIAFGGTLLPSKEHSIPSCYGSWNPTAINIPIKQLLKKKYFTLCTTEIFGGFQIIVDYKDEELPLVLEALERVDAHLTAAVVSNDVLFQNKVLSHTVNGTTYCGMRARTTGGQNSYTFIFLLCFYFFIFLCFYIFILYLSISIKIYKYRNKKIKSKKILSTCGTCSHSTVRRAVNSM